MHFFSILRSSLKFLQNNAWCICIFPKQDFNSFIPIVIMYLFVQCCSHKMMLIDEWYPWLLLSVVFSQDAARLLPSCRKAWKYSNNKVFWGPSHKTKRWKKGTANVLLPYIISCCASSLWLMVFVPFFFCYRCALWSWGICFAQN